MTTVRTEWDSWHIRNRFLGLEILAASLRIPSLKKNLSVHSKSIFFQFFFGNLNFYFCSGTHEKICFIFLSNISQISKILTLRNCYEKYWENLQKKSNTLGFFVFSPSRIQSQLNGDSQIPPSQIRWGAGQVLAAINSHCQLLTGAGKSWEELATAIGTPVCGSPNHIPRRYNALGTIPARLQLPEWC